MIINAKVRSHTGPRKVIELPKSVRDNFDHGEEVHIEKILKPTQKRGNEK